MLEYVGYCVYLFNEFERQVIYFNVFEIFFNMFKIFFSVFKIFFMCLLFEVMKFDVELDLENVLILFINMIIYVLCFERKV